jgi:transposase
MARAYSNDLRERAARLMAEGMPCREVAELLQVAPSSVVKWAQRQRCTGSAAAKPMGGVRRAVLAGERDWVLSRIKQAPDLTLAALRGELIERGTTVSLWAVWKLLQTERITFKKKSAAD